MDALANDMRKRGRQPADTAGHVYAVRRESRSERTSHSLARRPSPRRSRPLRTALPADRGTSASHSMSPGLGRRPPTGSASDCSLICCSANLANRPNIQQSADDYCSVNLGGDHASRAGDGPDASRSVSCSTTVSGSAASRMRRTAWRLRTTTTTVVLA